MSWRPCKTPGCARFGADSDYCDECEDAALAAESISAVIEKAVAAERTRATAAERRATEAEAERDAALSDLHKINAETSDACRVAGAELHRVMDERDAAARDLAMLSPFNPFEVWYVATARRDGCAPDPVKAIASLLYFTEEEASGAAAGMDGRMKAVAVRGVLTGRRVVEASGPEAPPCSA